MATVQAEPVRGGSERDPVRDAASGEGALRRLVEEHAAVSRVAVAVAQRPERVFEMVTEEVGRLLHADWATTVRFDGSDGCEVVGSWHAGEEFEQQVGTRFPLRTGAISQVKQTGMPSRDSYQLDSDSRRRQIVSAPIVVEGSMWGATTVSILEPGSFSESAEERLAKFTTLVAAALANAAAREELARLAEEQAALTRVAVAVASESRPADVFRVVTEEVGRLFDASASHLIRFSADRSHAVVAGQWTPEPGLAVIGIGDRVTLDGGIVTIVRDTASTARVEYENSRQVEFFDGLGVTCEIAVPVSLFGELWGAVDVATTSRASFPPGAEKRLGAFADLVGLALTNADARAELAASRARVVRAGDQERQRLERNLHDGAQQRLVTLSLSLRLAQARLHADPRAASALLDGAVTELGHALEELRELARGLHPAILTDHGLAPALGALAARAPLPVELAVPGERLPPSVEAAAYYVVAESLTNVAKYAAARSARVRVECRDRVALVEVEDDGRGGADPSCGSGLRGLADRVEALAGRLSVTSEPGCGTVVRAEIPVLDA